MHIHTCMWTPPEVYPYMQNMHIHTCTYTMKMEKLRKKKNKETAYPQYKQ